MSLIPDSVEDGGTLRILQILFATLITTVITLNIRREPLGFNPIQSSKPTPRIPLISAPTLEREIEGHQFAFWSLNGVRQATPSGAALNQVGIQSFF